MSGPPRIAPVPAKTRPELSVMIPTWRPDLDYLARAVDGVLGQLADDDPSVEIALVDDASPDFDAEAFVQRFAPRRIALHRAQDHRGTAGNWNACLDAARGRWVHLLHQDDYVQPGFYAALRRGAEHDPRVAAAFCAAAYVDADGRGWVPRLVPMTAPGVLVDWQRHVFERLAIQCSAIIVRRDVYETLGGFDPALRYALDWDMWRRIAARHPIWFHPEPLAAYRMHVRSETARQRADGRDLAEMFDGIARSAALLPPADAPRVVRRARFHATVFAVENALALLRSAGWSEARRYVRGARRGSSLTALAAAVAAVALRGGLRRLRRRR
jgi:glycosyltransferase involved in cell wall biosynthesis